MSNSSIYFKSYRSTASIYELIIFAKIRMYNSTVNKTDLQEKKYPNQFDTANEHEKEIKDLLKYVYEETGEFALNKILIRPQIISSSIDELIQNDVIFDEMLLKKDVGVNIRVIISDEDSNRVLLPKLNRNFDTVIIPHSGHYGNNRMHDKFCIIDMDYVMHRLIL